VLKKLSLKDIGTPISEEKGWTNMQVRHRRKLSNIEIIMVIKAPNKSVLVITDYPKITTRRKCKTIRAFMERNRRNGASH